MSLFLSGCNEESLEGDAYYYGTYEGNNGTLKLSKSSEKQSPVRFEIQTKGQRKDGSTWRCSFDGIGKLSTQDALGDGVSFMAFVVGQNLLEAAIEGGIGKGGREIWISEQKNCSKLGGSLGGRYTKKTVPVPQSMVDGVSCGQYDYFSIGKIEKYEKDKDGYAFKFNGWDGGKRIDETFGIPKKSKLYEIIDYYINHKGYIGGSRHLLLYFSNDKICGIVPAYPSSTDWIRSIKAGNDRVTFDICSTPKDSTDYCHEVFLKSDHEMFSRVKELANEFPGKYISGIYLESGEIKVIENCW